MAAILIHMVLILDLTGCQNVPEAIDRFLQQGDLASMCSRGDEEDSTRIGEKRRSRLARTMGDNRLTNIIKAGALLLATRLDSGVTIGEF